MILITKQICKSFGSLKVLEDISFEIDKPQIVFLLGVSGSGKSTLLRIISGLEYPESGEIILNGTNVTNLATEKRGIGFVFQNYALWPHLNVKEHVKFGLRFLPITKKEQENRINWVSDLTKITPLLFRYPHQLSGGQQQRVALARALATEPKVLLLDEPLANLDPSLRRDVLRELKSMRDELKFTIIYVTHNRDECLAAADKAIFLENGKIIQTGTARDLYNHPQTESIAQFFDETFFVTPECFKNHNEEQFIKDLDKGAKKIGFRPHHLHISTNADTNKFLKLTAKIIYTEYQGHHYRITGEIPNGVEIAFYHKNLESINLKDEVNLYISPKDLIFI